jgi:hypothetical protein
MTRRAHVGSVGLGVVAGFGLALVAISAPRGSAVAGADRGLGTTPAFSIDQEPLVIYDVSGFGLAGPIHERLSLYSSGLASYSAAGGFPQEGLDGSAAFTWVPIADARALHARVIAAGALSLEDLPDLGADIPLTTVTVFASGEPDADHNTYSYTFADDGQAEVAFLINDFIARTFPQSR